MLRQGGTRLGQCPITFHDTAVHADAEADEADQDNQIGVNGAKDGKEKHHTSDERSEQKRIEQLQPWRPSAIVAKEDVQAGKDKAHDRQHTEDPKRDDNGEMAAMVVAGEFGHLIVGAVAPLGRLVGEVIIRGARRISLAYPEVLSDFEPENPPHLQPPVGGSGGVRPYCGTDVDGLLYQLTDENETCNTFVNNYSHELDSELKKYQIELNIKINNFNGYTFTIQQMIETY